MNLRSEKLKRIKIQVMPLAPVALRLTRGPRIAETWVRLPASVRFFFIPLRPFFYAAIAKRWKVQFRNGLRK